MSTGLHAAASPRRWTDQRPLARLWAIAPAAIVVAVAVTLLLAEPDAAVTTFATVFLGVFFEALPFLLLGVTISALVQELVPPDVVTRWMPQGRLRAALAGAALGALVPVCECGVIPVARRLLQKGASLPAALGFMLAGPVVNPIVFWATWTALGPTMALLRVGTSLLMAVGVAWIYGFHPRPETVVASTPPLPHGGGEGSDSGAVDRHPAPARGAVADAEMSAAQRGAVGRGLQLLAAFGQAGDELLEMGRYLVVGAAAAATLRTVVPGPTLVAAGEGPILAVPLTMALAAMLSICSVVDAFVALSLTGLVSSGAMLAFLVYGPVVDVKSVLLYGSVFRWRTVIMLAILLTLLALVAGLAVSLHVG